MVPVLVSLPLAAAALSAYFAFRLVAMRSRPVAPAPATPDLRDEPPAVVNLLVNRMVDAPQVGSATLLDLAARRVVEIHEVADGPDHTLVRLRGNGLSGRHPGYERRVVDRVARVAGNRLTPVSRLAQRHADGGYQWQRGMVRDAVLDARRRGLIRRSDGGLALALATSGLVAAALLAPLVPRAGAEQFGGVGLLLACAWMVLWWGGGVLLRAVAIGGRAAVTDRYTSRGRRVTAHWLGVAAWLRAHNALRDLPPAAVAVWDRYLAYGVALDALPHAARVLDLETVGHRDVLQSDHTGRWRTVRVRHVPRRRLLRPAGPVAAQASLIWALITLPWWLAVGIGIATTVTSPYPRWPLLGLTALLAARSGFRLMRSVVDLARPVQVTGTVLDIGVAGQQHTADHSDAVGAPIPDLVTHYSVVVDDGSTDELRPWIVNRDIARGGPLRPYPPEAADLAAWHEDLVRPGFQPGDRVRLVGQRWSRFVSSLERLPEPAHPSSPIFTDRGRD